MRKLSLTKNTGQLITLAVCIIILGLFICLQSQQRIDLLTNKINKGWIGYRYRNNPKQYIKNLIKADYSSIDSPETSDWGKIVYLRQWVHENSDWGYGSAILNNKDLYGKNGQQIYKYFYYDLGGGQCNNVAYFLNEVYKIYGFRAYEYHSGELDSFNHVVNLVEIDYEGVRKLVVQDASFDTTYIDDRGHPYDFIELLNGIKNKKVGINNIRQGSAKPRDVYYDQESFEIHKTEISGDTSEKGGIIKAKVKFNIHTISDSSFLLFPRFLRDNYGKTFFNRYNSAGEIFGKNLNSKEKTLIKKIIITSDPDTWNKYQ